MQAVRIDTTIDQAIILAIPGLSPMLGCKVELIALALEPTHTPLKQPKIKFDEFLKLRLKRPEDVLPVALENMEQAIIKGALNGNILH